MSRQRPTPCVCLVLPIIACSVEDKPPPTVFAAGEAVKITGEGLQFGSAIGISGDEGADLLVSGEEVIDTTQPCPDSGSCVVRSNGGWRVPLGTASDTPVGEAATARYPLAGRLFDLGDVDGDGRSEVGETLIGAAVPTFGASAVVLSGAAAEDDAPLAMYACSEGDYSVILGLSSLAGAAAGELALAGCFPNSVTIVPADTVGDHVLTTSEPGISRLELVARGAVVQAGDLSGDGVGDLIVPERERVSQFDGPFDARVDGTSAVGSLAMDTWASALAVGDLDGDGRAEVIVADEFANDGGGWVGVFQGPLTGSVLRGDATLSITGVPSDEVGSAVGVAPGVLFVGASGSGGDARNPGPGAVYRLPGVATGGLSTTDMDLVLTGSVDGAGIGSSLAVAPGSDGDALAVGAPQWPGGDDPAGAVWIITGLAD